MEAKLSDLVYVFDDALEKSVCDNLMKIFENESNHENISQPGVNFDQITLFNDSGGHSKEYYDVLFALRKFKDIYLTRVGPNYFPTSYSYEEVRIKRYQNNGKQLFDTHVDVVDHQTSKRFLAFLFYLNDVDDGGETVFDFGHVNAKCGRLLMFPPLWMYPHKGSTPISGAKYIMSSYLHYN